MYHHGTRSRDSQAFSRLNCSLDHLCSKYLFLVVVQKCFVFIPCFIGRFYKSGNECNWTNTEQLVFTKPCPQKEFMKTWKYVFHAFQFRLNLSGTKPQFAEIFRYYINESEIIQNRGFRSTLNERRWQSGKKPVLCMLGLLSTIIRGREPSDQESVTHEKIALAHEHNWAPITSTSAREVAHTSASRLGHPARGVFF